MKQIILLIVLAAVVIGLAAILPAKNDSPEPKPADTLNSTPTNFVNVGTITFNTPGLTPNTPHFIYEAPGQPALTKAVSIDALTACVTNAASVPCIAMSTTLDAAFNGKRVLIDGIENETGILARKIRLLGEDETPLLYDPGNVFISWPQAVGLIEACEITAVTQTHSLDVYLTLPDERRVVAVEPMIDEVFSVLERANCSNVIIATE